MNSILEAMTQAASDRAPGIVTSLIDTGLERISSPKGDKRAAVTVQPTPAPVEQPAAPEKTFIQKYGMAIAAAVAVLLIGAGVYFATRKG